ncbi:MAG: winged helix-turn-helix transcriptional regulator [Alphaproteobacteria bacterium]|nr:winged helix-turn-helix transcriptional regulator [Alphaproteobacteria bacterium]
MPLELKPLTALTLWRDVTLESVRSELPDLTQRQLAILLHVYLMPPPHTVRGLAATLNVTKPAITRALDTLGRTGLLKRRRDDADRRNVLIQRTVKGSIFLSDFGDRVTESAKKLDS